jgi:hypothetical protein
MDRTRGGELPNPDIESPKEMGGPAVKKETVKTIATHQTQHRLLLTSRQRQSNERTKQEGKDTQGVLNAEKVIMNKTEVSDVKKEMGKAKCVQCDG